MLIMLKCYTNTNQIKDHILSDTKNENRKLFFYNLYLNKIRTLMLLLNKTNCKTKNKKYATQSIAYLTFLRNLY